MQQKNGGAVLQIFWLLSICGYPAHILVQQHSCNKKAPFEWGQWSDFWSVESVALIFNRDFKFRRLDIDGFNGFTDDTSDGVEHLACGLQLSFLQGLMKEFGAHVLKPREHVFAISLPVFINKLFNFCSIAPSGLNRDLFFLFVVVHEGTS